MKVKNKDGKEVIITSTGSKFQNIGKLTISANGEITTQLIPTDSYEKVDKQISEYITEIQEEYAALGNRKIGTSEVFLTTVDENGNRIIRSEETNLGDFCADAFRVVTGADVGMINGGGIRDNISAGDVTFNDILSVFPWNNTVCVVKVTGQQIIDMLELSVMYCPNENGTFQHVSGITFDIDISIPTTVILDEQERFVGVGGARRVSNVKILDKETNKYIPIDTEKEYSLASHNYLLLDQGGGATMFDNAEIIVNDGMLDVELLEVYIIDYLSGNIGSEYATAQNRIVITDGTSETPTVGDNSDMVVMAIILAASAFSAALCVKGKKQR
jgi:2',3'-cyclic-nucleotide 2'-phosphodiesterase (5'-nucleotidase family)